MKKIYVVEDDENIRELIVYALTSSGFTADSFDTGRDFFSALQKELPDLALLDIMLPDEDGISILRKLRQDRVTARLPVIMVTARGSEYDRIKGLDLGADDYVPKPFSVLELISRIKAVLRRTAAIPDEKLLTFENITVNTQKHAVAVDGEGVLLTLKEFELLHYLVQNRGIVLTREKIMNQIWGFGYEGESRTVDMHVKTLRQKLGSAGEHIKTIRGVGYKIGE